MPHYKNGREAKLGDAIVNVGWNGLPIAGIVAVIQPSSDLCNAQVVPMSPTITVSLQECLHIEDAMAVVPVTETPSV